MNAAQLTALDAVIKTNNMAAVQAIWESFNTGPGWMYLPPPPAAPIPAHRQPAGVGAAPAPAPAPAAAAAPKPKGKAKKDGEGGRWVIEPGYTNCEGSADYCAKRKWVPDAPAAKGKAPKAEKKPKGIAKKSEGPKRAKTAFMLFSARERERLKKEQPDMDQKLVMGELGARWKALSDAKKAKWNKLGAEEKEAFEANKAAAAGGAGPSDLDAEQAGEEEE
jgi:hypothetical protein